MEITVGSSWVLLNKVYSILKAVASPLEKLLFERAYEISSQVKCLREVLGRFPHLLTDDIEYDFHWSKYYLRNEIFCPLFWIKSRSGKRYSKIVLAITASGRHQKHQCPLTLYDLGPLPIRTTLPSIPLRVLNKNILVENARVFMPFSEIEVKLVELWDESGQPIHVTSRCLPLSPMDRLEVAMGRQRGDVEKWGNHYNLEFLESEMEEERVRLIAPYFMARRLPDRLKRKVFGWMWVVQISFWSKNLIWAFHLSKEFAKVVIREQETDKYRKKQSEFPCLL